MDLNRVELIGHLVADPKPRKTSSGTSTARFTVATGRKPKAGKATAEYHRAVAYGRIADVVAKYLKKADRVYLDGRLTVATWSGKDGQKRSQPEIVADNLIMLGGPKREEEVNADVVEEEIEVPDEEVENGEG